ncbi:MAG: hypothetical protein EOO11_03425 [Chitinophagaceae bacterium]|nr:MAG: hypothetical protein EOO11_03425 [Chitinophagaceae bacterium]
MALNDTDEQLLIRYLDGELDATEAAALEARLQQEPELKAGLERLELAARALHWGALGERVAAARAQHEQQLEAPPAPAQAPVRSLRWLRTALTAAAVLAGLWIGIRWWDSTHLTPEQVYGRHFIDYQLSAERGDGIFPQVEAAYTGKQFAHVYTYRQQDTLLSERQRLLVALSALHLDKPAEAEERLRPLQAGRYGEDATFYRALALIRLNRPHEALPLLEAIRRNPAHLYHSRVTEEMIRQVQTLD